MTRLHSTFRPRSLTLPPLRYFLALLALAALLLPPPAAHAQTTTRFVSNAGDDTGNDCTGQATPCATIMHAIGEASSGDTVQVAAGTYTEHLSIDKNLTLLGAGEGSDPASNTIIQAHGGPGMAEDSVVRVEFSRAVTISGVRVRHGGGGSPFVIGGGIFNDGLLFLTDSTVTANRAVNGGGIWNNAGRTLVVTGSTISGNIALTGDGSGGTGGGIFNRGTASLTNSTVSGNTSVSGGGVSNEPGRTLNVTGSTISDNTARFGGGIYNDNGTVHVQQGSAVSGNSAIADATQINIHANGGGILNSSSGGTPARLFIHQDSLVTGNIVMSDPANPNSTADGGGIWNGGSGATVTVRPNATVADNSASDDGGGIWNGLNGTVIVEAATISGNTASGAGGGIWNGGFDSPTVTVTDSSISGNTAVNGGGIFNWADTFVDAGGNIISGEPALTVTGTSITGNTGGGIVNDSATTANATGNWWGSATGPTHASNPGGSGESISNGVAYSPWCADPGCSVLYAIPTRLAFTTQPGDGAAGEPLSPQPVVRAEDEEGHLGVNFDGLVTLTSDPSATLESAEVNAVTGTAAFTDLSVTDAGTYSLIASADALTSATSASFTVASAEEADTTPPEITVPDDITAEAAGPEGAVVIYTATATDEVDGPVDVTCEPPSSATFPLGTTTVNCTATDTAGNEATASFTVTVEDTTPPVLDLPGDLTVEATGPDGAVVTYTAAATDLVDGAVAVSCAPPSGDTFALGAITVTCTATDDAGNEATASFTITVEDTTPPEITVPADITAEATSADGAVVEFTVTALDLVDGVTAVTCTPPSGSAFPVGETEVTCTTTDDAGNTATGSFTVTVTPLPSVITIDALITAVEDAITAETLVGDGPGNSGAGRLGAWRNMLDAANALIEAGDVDGACGQLRQAYLRVDGNPRPPDFVTGPAAAELAQMVLDLMAELGCP